MPTIGAERTSMRYRSIRPDDAVLRSRLRELAAERRRFGYRRLRLMLKREGTLGPWIPPPGGFAGGKIAYNRIPSTEDFW